jgi:hypothetical protein
MKMRGYNNVIQVNIIEREGKKESILRRCRVAKVGIVVLEPCEMRSTSKRNFQVTDLKIQIAKVSEFEEKRYLFYEK